MAREIFYRPHKLRCTDSNRTETVHVRSVHDGQRWQWHADSFDCVPAYVRTRGKTTRGFVHTDKASEAVPPAACFTPHTASKREFIIYQLEETDTFGGEANYCWANRAWVRIPADMPQRSLVALVKRWAGYKPGNACRVDVSNFGDTLEIRPRPSTGLLRVIFASYFDDHSGSVEPSGEEYVDGEG